MAEKWMQNAVKRPGSFRKWLGKKEGEKVSSEDIAKGLRSKNPRIKKKAVLARTFRKFRRGGSRS